jgi:hypothetical protein
MLYKWNLGGFGPCNGQTLTACQTLTTAREKQSLNNCPRERASCEKIENITNVKYAESKICRSKIANICEKIRKTKIHKFYQTSAAKPAIGHHCKTKIHKFYQTSENHPIGP